VADPYEKYADIFMSSMAGEMSGLTKEQFIALCKSKFPDEVAFAKQMDSLAAAAEKHIEQAQAQLKPGETLGIAYPIEVPTGKTH
jgi:hypothetical protein